jgi:hypothetical protein
MSLLTKLEPFDRKSGNLNVVIDTPKGIRNKYAFDIKIDVMRAAGNSSQHAARDQPRRNA